jgi:hypothetical protein
MQDSTAIEVETPVPSRISNKNQMTKVDEQAR